MTPVPVSPPWRAVERWSVRLLLAVAIVATTLVAPVVVHAAPDCAHPTGVYAKGQPWAQRTLAPQRIWPITRGQGQLVAVVGTGVDASNRQLAGRLGHGSSVGTQGDADSDCDGRGTVAAGMIAATEDGSTTFVGLAPGAKVLPVRYTQTQGNSDAGPDPDRLAAAITAATKAGASVICVAVPAERTSKRLNQAVRAAHDADAVLVSPARIGANGDPVGRSYPTALADVLGVASAAESGAAASTEDGDYLDVAAPGAGVVATSAGTGGAVGHVWSVSDPSAAAGYAAGAVALLRAYRPELSAAQVVARMTGTADRAASGRHDPRLGWGLIDPYAAVTAELPGRHRPRSTGPSAVTAARAASGPVDPHHTMVLLLGFGGPAAAILLTLAVLTVRRGRARSWRPSRARSSA